MREKREKERKTAQVSWILKAVQPCQVGLNGLNLNEEEHEREGREEAEKGKRKKKKGKREEKKGRKKYMNSNPETCDFGNKWEQEGKGKKGRKRKREKRKREEKKKGKKK